MLLLSFSSVRFSHCCVLLFVTLWTAACQLSITNSRCCSNSCPSNRWCHPIVSSSVVPFSSCLQSFPASILLLSKQSPGIWCDSPRPQSIRSNNRYISLDSIVYHLTCGSVWNRHSRSVPNFLRIFSIKQLTKQQILPSFSGFHDAIHFLFTHSAFIRACSMCACLGS